MTSHGGERERDLAEGERGAEVGRADGAGERGGEHERAEHDREIDSHRF